MRFCGEELYLKGKQEAELNLFDQERPEIDAVLQWVRLQPSTTDIDLLTFLLWSTLAMHILQHPSHSAQPQSMRRC
jgi:hypothetical protein